MEVVAVLVAAPSPQDPETRRRLQMLADIMEERQRSKGGPSDDPEPAPPARVSLAPSTRASFEPLPSDGTPKAAGGDEVFLRQASAPFATDASLTQRAGTTLASVEAQLLSLNQEKEALQGSINRLKKSTTVKRWTIVDETNKADARLQEIEGELSRLRMWLRRNGKT